MTCERLGVLPTADACRWLLLSPLLSGTAVSDGSYPSSEASRERLSLARGNRPVTARTVQGMAPRPVRQAPAWPLSSDRSVRRDSRTKRDVACIFTRHFPPVLACGAVSRSFDSSGRSNATRRTPRAPLGPRSVLAHKVAEIGPEAWIAAAQADAKLHERRDRATAWVVRGQSA